MTREEAINELEILKENYWDDDGYGHETKQYDDTMLALDMAIKALEQEPCEDAVSREAVENFKAEMMEWITSENRGSCDYFIVDKIEEIIKNFNLPSVTPKPKTGHWKYIGNGHNGLFECGNCGAHRNMFNELEEYCYACGARMKSEE